MLGSGNHARSYLHRTARGTLVELPLGWYSEKGGYWAMSPGSIRGIRDPTAGLLRMHVLPQWISPYPRGARCAGQQPVLPATFPKASIASAATAGRQSRSTAQTAAQSRERFAPAS